MLIGNRNRLAIELHSLVPTWERHYLPERSAWARFSLWVDGLNLCRNLLDGSPSVRDGVNVPLAPVADWLVRSWTFLAFEERPECFPLRGSLRDTVRDWGNAPAPADCNEDDWSDARERWWTRHFLSAGAEGAQLPNVSLIRGDDRLFIEWAPAEFAGNRAPQYLSESGRATVRWAESEEVLTEFVSTVARWLREDGLVHAFPWACREDPLHEVEAGFGEKLCVYTGISVDRLRAWTRADTEADLRERLGIRADSNDPGGSVITQVLRNLPPEISESVRDQIWRLDQETRSVTDFAGELRALAHDAAGTGSDPETSGQRAAQGIRDHLDLDGRPIEDVDGQLRAFGVNVIDSDVECSQERMLAGSRRGFGAAAVINRTPRTETPWGRRFESARALGHLLMDSFREDALGAASTAFAQPWARRRSGAFAAEFLLPSEALREDAGALDSSAQPEKFRRILQRYRVGARTTAFQLWNHGLLSSRRVCDELIDKFSNVEQ